jgi:hypothetical protein
MTRLHYLSKIDSKLVENLKCPIRSDYKTKQVYFRSRFFDQKVETKPELAFKVNKLARLSIQNEINVHKRFLYFNLSDFLINTIDTSNQNRYNNEQLYEIFHLPNREYLVFNRFAGHLTLFNEHNIALRQVFIKLIKVKSKVIQIIGDRVVIVLANSSQTVHFIYLFDFELNMVRSKALKNVLYLKINQNFVMFESSLKFQANRIELLDFGLEKVDQFSYGELDSHTSLFDMLTRISFIYILPDRFVLDTKHHDELVLEFFDRTKCRNQRAQLVARVEINKCESYAIKVDRQSRVYAIVEVFVDDYYDEALVVRNLAGGGNRENLYCYDLSGSLLFKRFVAVLDDLESVDLMNQLG